MPAWNLEKGCEGVRELVEASASKLLYVVLNQVKYDVVIVNFLSDRFYEKCGTLYFSCGEMTLIPDDAQQILCRMCKVKLLGSYTKERKWDQLHILTKKLFCWDEETSEG